MPKATRTLSGASQEKYFRDLFAAEPGLTREGAERLRALCREEVSQLRVRAPIPKRNRRADEPAAKHDSEAPTGVIAAPPSVEAPPPTSAGDPETTPAREGAPADSLEKFAEAAPEPPFDPYAFSLLALLKRSGPDALRSRLDEIASPQSLHKLAEAQHIALPPGIDAAADIREAIVTGTEQRLADRRAAAS